MNQRPAYAGRIRHAPRRAAGTGAAEQRLAWRAAAFAAVVAAPVVAVATLIAGRDAGLGAAAGAGLVLALVACSGVALAWAARARREHTTPIMLGGVALRMGGSLALLAALAPVEALHRQSFAAALALVLVATLGYELVHLARTPQLFWVYTDNHEGSRE